jgi:hypothetical protein
MSKNIVKVHFNQGRILKAKINAAGKNTSRAAHGYYRTDILNCQVRNEQGCGLFHPQNVVLTIGRHMYREQCELYEAGDRMKLTMPS